LLQIKKCQKNISKKRKPLPKVVVTDQSFAIINSLSETFNNCTISQYLDWTFDLLLKKSNNTFSNTTIPVILYLCATHFLKNIVIKTNEILKLKKNYRALDNETLIKIKIKKLFVCSFSLLQISVNMVDFNAVLIDLFYIFCSKTEDETFKKSFDRISKGIYLRGNTVMFDVSKDDEEEIKLIDEFKFILPENKESIKLNSKFQSYYTTVVLWFLEMGLWAISNPVFLTILPKSASIIKEIRFLRFVKTTKSSGSLCQVNISLIHTHGSFLNTYNITSISQKSHLSNIQFQMIKKNGDLKLQMQRKTAFFTDRTQISSRILFLKVYIFLFFLNYFK